MADNLLRATQDFHRFALAYRELRWHLNAKLGRESTS